MDPKPRKMLRNHEMEKIKHFFQDESGAVVVEYCLLVVLIALLIISTVRLIGTDLSSKFDSIATALE